MKNDILTEDTRRQNTQRPSSGSQENSSNSSNEKEPQDVVVVNEKYDTDAYLEIEGTPVAIIKHEGRYKGVIGNQILNKEGFSTQQAAVRAHLRPTWPAVMTWFAIVYEWNRRQEEKQNKETE